MKITNPATFEYIKAYNGEKVSCFIAEIGGWNMDITADKNISFAVNMDLIISIHCFIRDDDGVVKLNFEQDNGVVGTPDGFIGFSGGQIQLNRRAGGYFDSVDFDDDGINRGYVICWYES